MLATIRITHRLAGQPRTLSTPLSVDECLRRLRDGVYAHPALIKPNKWQEFRADRTLRRKLRGHHFTLALDPRDHKRHLFWHLSGSIQAHDQTTITCQYHMARVTLITVAIFGSLLVLYGLYALFASFNDWGVTVCSRYSGCRPVEPEDERWFGGLNLIMASVVFVMPWWLGRAKDRQDEEHLVRFLETTLEAKEQAVTDNTVTILDTSLPTFTPSSQRWTLRTALSVDECMRRLREGFAPDWYAQHGGWWPLRTEQAFVKVDGPRFLLTTRDNRRVSGRGFLVDELARDADGHTHITGYFHATTRVRWVLMILLAVCLVVVAVAAWQAWQSDVPIEYRGRLRPPRQVVCLLGLMVPYVLLLLGVVWGSRKQHPKDEQHLVTVVQRLLDAEDM